MPSLPVLPPSGITPEVPVRPTPPIGTLPPEGITPELPVRPLPPIATLPPNGITPEIPTRPTPPIGTLPPDGITPGRPVQPSPPVGTLPPGGATPGIPAAPSPPIGVLPPPEATQSADARLLTQAGALLWCRDAAGELTPETAGKVRLVDCDDPRQRAAVDAQSGFGARTPITPGREFAAESLWNAWVDARHTRSTDHRYSLDTRGRSDYVAIGADRRISSDLVAGINATVEGNNSDGFGGEFAADSNGFSIGPYVGYRISQHWSLDASLGYGRLQNDSRIADLTGSYTTQRYSAAVNATGQYALAGAQVRPKLSVWWLHFRNEGYSLNGTVAGTPVALRVAESSFNFGVSEASVEVNKAYQARGGSIVVPYAELGASYQFERPNGGQLLTGTLSTAVGSPWSGLLRTGARVLVSRSTFVEASLGYLSFTQNGLDVWEARLFVSHAF
jgi:hypothetical protein